MQISWNWTELCGPNDFDPIFRSDYTMSICAEMSIIRLPILFVFMLTSTFYFDHMSNWIIRTRRETNILRCRIVIASFLTILPAIQFIWEIYVYTESSIYPIENIVLVIQCFTWLIHTLYIFCIKHNFGTNLRGSKVVIFAWILCFLSSIISLRNTYNTFIQSTYLPILQLRLWFTVYNCMLQMFYLITMFFKEDPVRIRHVDRLRYLAQVNITITCILMICYYSYYLRKTISP